MKAGYLKEFVMDSRNQGAGHDAQQKGNPLPSPLRVIEVVHAAPRGTTIIRRGVLTVTPMENCLGEQPSKKKIKIGRGPIAFDEEDLEGMIQPHEDALAVMMRISGFLVKRMMVDQGSGVDVMYSDLFEGLGLKNQ